MSVFHIHAAYDQLHVLLDGDLFARYRFLGARRPYLWPLNAREGSVVRGAGTGDHPHQQGLYLAYGLHGHNGATNIWSDWDEPPYGVCGAMHHLRFSSVEAGGFEEWLIYTNGDGRPIAEEVRRVSFSAPGAVRRIEWESHVLWLNEHVAAPFHFSVRPATSIYAQPNVRSSSRDAVSASEPGHAALWMDMSGPVGDGRAGVTVHDHPDNPDPSGDFWRPNALLLTHHAPVPFPAGGLFLRFRADVHSGDEPSL
jgi:hypothetical protein